MDYTSMEIGELRAIASKRGIRPGGKYPAHCTKEVLISALGDSSDAPPQSPAIPSDPPRVVDIGQAFLSILSNLFNTELEQTWGRIEDRIAQEIEKRGASFAPRFEIRIKDGDLREIPGTHHAILKDVVAAAALRLNILLFGPSGSGKTYLANQVAQSLGLRFGAMSLTAGISEAWLLGRFIPGEGGRYEYQRAPFVDFYGEGGVYLLDEIDAGDPNVLLVINSALANGHLALPSGAVVERHPDFVLIATGNTWGGGANRIYSGRSQLDASTIDRFVGATFLMDYDTEMEKRLLPDFPQMVSWAHRAREALASQGVRRVISTRFLITSAILLRAGIATQSECFERLLTTWTEPEREAVRKVLP